MNGFALRGVSVGESVPQRAVDCGFSPFRADIPEFRIGVAAENSGEFGEKLERIQNMRVFEKHLVGLIFCVMVTERAVSSGKPVWSGDAFQIFSETAEHRVVFRKECAVAVLFPRVFCDCEKSAAPQENGTGDGNCKRGENLEVAVASLIKGAEQSFVNTRFAGCGWCGRTESVPMHRTKLR